MNKYIIHDEDEVRHHIAEARMSMLTNNAGELKERVIAGMTALDDEGPEELCLSIDDFGYLKDTLMDMGAISYNLNWFVGRAAEEGNAAIVTLMKHEELVRKICQQHCEMKSFLESLAKLLGSPDILHERVWDHHECVEDFLSDEIKRKLGSVTDEQ